MMSDKILFIHGMFQNAKSWGKWTTSFEEKGYGCQAVSWPMHEGEPQQLREQIPSGLGDLRLQTVVDHYVRVIEKEGRRPIVIGHSVGGLIVQILANRNLIKAGVCISSVAPNRMLSFDWGFFKNSMSIANPLKGDEPFMMTPDGFHSSFANSLSEAVSNEAYLQFATHDSRNILRDCMLEAGEVDLELPHVPLLFIGGEKDRIVPPDLNEKNSKAYKDETSLTQFKEFSNRSHFICGEPGWQEVAEYASKWLKETVASDR